MPSPNWSSLLLGMLASVNSLLAQHHQQQEQQQYELLQNYDDGTTSAGAAADGIITSSTIGGGIPSSHSFQSSATSFSSSSSYSSPSPSLISLHPEILVYGFVLVLIPTATILGNVLVIISVLRFKALHSAINFLILGLAIADLMVAIFVMPYAVYVYIQGGQWLLGPLMCNLYLSSDVACSTASIILLAMISFDRYKAISQPIQYSRQAQNICRVVKLFVFVWIYSFCVASPIVLGFNEPADPTTGADNNPFECRFYNAYFSLLSSLVSFVLPCCVVIFVYVRIIRALRLRERAARLRKARQSMAAAAQPHQTGAEGQQHKDGEEDEAGEIVAGPAVNMMMIALPSLNRQIKRYERHRRALEEVEDGLVDDDEECSSLESLSEDVRILTNDFLSEVPTTNSKASASTEAATATAAGVTHYKQQQSAPQSPAPTSPPASICLPTVYHAALEPLRSGTFLISRFRSSFSGAMAAAAAASTPPATAAVPSSETRKKSMPAADDIVPSIFTPRKRSVCDVGAFSFPPQAVSASCTDRRWRKQQQVLPVRSRSNREDRSREQEQQQKQQFEQRQRSATGGARLLLLPLQEENNHHHQQQQEQQNKGNPKNGAVENAAERTHHLRHHQPCCAVASLPLIRRNGNGAGADRINANYYPVDQRSTPPTPPTSPISPMMRNGGPKMPMATSPNGELQQNGHLPMKASTLAPPSLPFRRGHSAAQLPMLGSNNSKNREAKNNEKTRILLPHEKSKQPQSSSVLPSVSLCPATPTQLLDEVMTPNEKERVDATSNGNNDDDDYEGRRRKKERFVGGGGIGTTTNTTSSSGGDGAEDGDVESAKQRLLETTTEEENGTKNADGGTVAGAERGSSCRNKDRGASLRRKVCKSQRKEKRATKTLGIVVGTFLCCWVPFFSLNIINAVCLELHVGWCQVGFGPFFYTTWIGYMNSFMNPVIYTIFNGEFRRAFKSLLLGRRTAGGRR